MAAGAAPERGAAEDTQTLEFPEGFLWGSATAAYQIEGASSKGGRTPCIWDSFCAVPGKVTNSESGAVACDHYHRFREDVKIMKDLGLPAYRFSVSWSRLLPAGRGEPNPEAVEFYNALIDELIDSGIRPLCTIYHWDLPQCLEDEYGGWLDRKVVDDFEHYAVCCFVLFGDRVKDWITFNEPWCSTVLGNQLAKRCLTLVGLFAASVVKVACGIAKRAEKTEPEEGQGILSVAQATPTARWRPAAARSRTRSRTWPRTTSSWRTGGPCSATAGYYDYYYYYYYDYC